MLGYFFLIMWYFLIHENTWYGGRLERKSMASRTGRGGAAHQWDTWDPDRPIRGNSRAYAQTPPYMGSVLELPCKLSVQNTGNLSDNRRQQWQQHQRIALLKGNFYTSLVTICPADISILGTRARAT